MFRSNITTASAVSLEVSTVASSVSHGPATLEHLLNAWSLQWRVMTAASDIVCTLGLELELLTGIGEIVREGQPDTRNPRVLALIESVLGPRQSSENRS